MSVSRRTLLLAGGTAATLLPLGGIMPAAQAAAPSAAGATPAPTPIPDPLPVTGTWTRTSDGGQRVTADSREPALALSEQQLAANGIYAARITPRSPSSVGALVFRAAIDGSTEYAVALDPGRARIRLYDLAGGDTIATAPLPGARTGKSFRRSGRRGGAGLRDREEDNECRGQGGCGYTGPDAELARPGTQACRESGDAQFVEPLWGATGPAGVGCTGSRSSSAPGPAAATGSPRAPG
ncbi:hypothetical protein ACFPH6_32420 [Streptomyces xiangluensis]|uniref:Uncharacterized protein n=1 Tax=Streptomyces xiangluensis TaxID=2665720 RepID=A0ABV8YZ22_9ACTN